MATAPNPEKFAIKPTSSNNGVIVLRITINSIIEILPDSLC